MSKMGWPAKAAKRIVAEAVLRAAIVEIEDERPAGGPKKAYASGYKVARHLAHHAAEQLRLSEGEGE